MHVVIAGGSGFLGRALHARLRRDGHLVRTLTRRPRPGVTDEIAWQPDGTAGSWAAALDGADAVVNLAGENLAAGRWTDARKQALRSSRLLPTRSLVAAITAARQPPSVLVSASAVGYYGDRGEELVTEHTEPGSDFLATLCVEWEHEAEQASSHTRVVLLRTAPVIHPNEGMLKQMLLPFRLGLGGKFGSGRQYMSWIHLDDWTREVSWLIETPEARGAFNVTAPQPVTNAEFTRALGRALGRPAILTVPSFALRAVLGELSHALLTGQRAVPARAQEMGFAFRFETIDAALHDLLR